MTTFSIIIPVKRGGHIAALDSIRRLSVDTSLYELLIAEGSAPSQQRNLAAQAARGDVLYFLDDDSLLNSENLRICGEVLRDLKVAAVGGPSITPVSDSWLQQLFGHALASSLGTGSVRNRYRATGSIRETTDKELILCNLAIRRSVFVDLGGFDERLYPNEENELLDRIRSSGFKLIHSPAMSISRSQRSTLKAFIRQMFAYGRGRAQQSLISGSFSFVSFVPLLFTLYLIFSVFFPANTLLLVPLLVYSVLVASFAIAGTYETGRLYMLALLLIYPLMHCVNGAGLLCGLLGGKPSPVRDDDIVITRIKEFGQKLPEP
ncbi:MAG: glycosyltransferase [Steroidobacteraceae bacterium]|nr:glycosyltransferase [Deltaproteobacteria bacterium]